MGIQKRWAEHIEGVEGTVIGEFVERGVLEMHEDDHGYTTFEVSDDSASLIRAACKNLYGRRNAGELGVTKEELRGLIHKVMSENGLTKSD